MIEEGQNLKFILETQDGNELIFEPYNLFYQNYQLTVLVSVFIGILGVYHD